MTRVLQQCRHRQVHCALSILFPQVGKLSQKQSPTSPVRFSQRFTCCGIAPGLGETRLFWIYARPRFLEGVSCDPSWQCLALGGTGLPRDGEPLGQVQLRSASAPQPEGVLSSYKFTGAPPWQSSLLKKYL